MLETRRLRLRRFAPSDEPALIALDSDEEVMRYIGSRGGTPEEIVARVRERVAADHGALGWWRVEGKDDGTFHGVGALLRMPEGDDVELAYRLARASWGRGIATEAAMALTGYAIGEVGLPRVVAVTFPENTASQRVLRKLGFVHDGLADYKSFRVVHFTLAAGAWRRGSDGSGAARRPGRGRGRRVRR
jgi:RimJ/RimL family protein N-acetyltransferase